MNSLELKKDVIWLGALDPDLRIFDIIMYTEFGTTYNSYLVIGSEKIALIETVKVKFFDEYISKLKQYIDISKIDYVIVNHTEPDHVGSVEKLLQLAPNAKVVGSRTALEFLSHIVNDSYESLEANEQLKIDLGNKTLEFISAPFLHWPDSMYTYCKEDKTLFTCDSFGAHYCFDEILLSKIENRDDYYKALRYYFDMIFGPFKKYMLQAIAKVEQLEIDMICNGHGPVLDINPMEIVALSKLWSDVASPYTKKTVIVPYVSAYGYTKSIAEAIVKGIQSIENIDVEMYDMVYADKNEVAEKMEFADGLLFGSPTINGDMLPPIRDLLGMLSPIVHNNKLAAGFGSYGWSGEAVPNIENRLLELRMNAIQGLRIRFKPSIEELEQAEAFGKQFAQLLVDPDQSIPVLKRATFETETHDDVDGNVKLWRCVICGEIYEGVEPPRTCPACSASSEQFEVYLSDDSGYKSSKMERFVIIGGSAAGVAAAEAIRKRNHHAEIVIIDKENELAYYRPVLTAYLGESHQKESFYLHDKYWYAKERIQLKLGIEVIGCNTESRSLVLSNGETEVYDQLIVATGAKNFVPPIPNVHLKGIYNLRTKADADDIKKHLMSCRKVAVIGGGLLGLEAAWEMRKMGKEVIVFEVADRILPRQLDTEASLLFEEGILRTGIQVRKQAKVVGFEGDDFVTKVILENEADIEVEGVIVSVGIRANTDLAVLLGLEVQRGIVVNRFMQTSIANIYAAGDCCEYNGINYGIWPEAIKQGMVAGINAVGDLAEYEDFIPSNIFNGCEMNIISVGDFGTNPNETYQTINQIDEKQLLYKKLYFVNDRCVGGIILGDVNKSAKLIKGVMTNASMAQMIGKIIN